MCIIAAKPIGVEPPTRSILENCFNNNPDGAGFMLATAGNVRIHKGFMTFDDFWRVYEKDLKRVNPKETAIVYHFRISTQGGVTPGGTHPFPVSSSPDMLTKTSVRCNLGVAHNGVISLTSSYAKNQIYSDTQLFIMDYLSKLDKLHPTWYKSKVGRELVEELIGSKLAILDKDGTIETIGDFNEFEGVLYSNHSWENWYGYQKYGFSTRWLSSSYYDNDDDLYACKYLTDLAGSEDVYVRDDEGEYHDLDPFLHAISASGIVYEIVDDYHVVETPWRDPVNGELKTLKHDYKNSRLYYIMPESEVSVDDMNSEEIAKYLITDFFRSRYNRNPNFTNLDKILVAAEVDGRNNALTQVYADIKNFKLSAYNGGKLIAEESWENIEDYVDTCLSFLHEYVTSYTM